MNGNGSAVDKHLKALAAVRFHHNIACSHRSRLRTGGHRQRIDARHLSHPAAPRIVHTHHGMLRSRTEKRGLSLEILLHRVVKIQVILGQISKSPHCEMCARHSAQRNRVAGDLHHHMRDPLVPHLGKQFLELRGLRRSQLRGNSHAINASTRGTDQPHLMPFGHQTSLQKVTGGRLTGGSRNTDHGQLLRRIPKHPGRYFPQHRTHMRNYQDWASLPRLLQDLHTCLVRENRGGLRICGKGRTMNARPWYRREQRPRGEFLGHQPNSLHCNVLTLVNSPS